MKFLPAAPRVIARFTTEELDALRQSALGRSAAHRPEDNRRVDPSRSDDQVNLLGCMAEAAVATLVGGSWADAWNFGDGPDSGVDVAGAHGWQVKANFSGRPHLYLKPWERFVADRAMLVAAAGSASVSIVGWTGRETFEAFAYERRWRNDGPINRVFPCATWPDCPEGPGLHPAIGYLVSERRTG